MVVAIIGNKRCLMVSTTAGEVIISGNRELGEVYVKISRKSNKKDENLLYHVYSIRSTVLRPKNVVFTNF